VDKKKMRKLLYIYIAIILVLVFSSRTIYNFSLPRVSAAMPQQGWINKELEARGVIEFAETFDILATSNGWIDEIFINPGDEIGENALIAAYNISNSANVESLKFAVERAEHNLAVLTSNKLNTQDNLRALSAQSLEDLHQLEWAVADAQATLEMRHHEFIEAQQLALMQDSGFGSAQAANNAEREWNRLLAELQEAIAVIDYFDDYSYQNRITEASIAVERRTAALREAEADLASIIESVATPFDRHNYQNAINTARFAYNRNVEDYETALQQHNDALFAFHALIITGATPAEILMAESTLNAAQNSLTIAGRARDDAHIALNQATDAMRRSENAFNANSQKARAQAVTDAETRVELAERNLTDAVRDYDSAVSALDRGKDAAANAARNRIADVQVALDESVWATHNILSIAEINLANAYQNLERTEINLDLAQQSLVSQMDNTRNALEQSLQQIDFDIAMANINLREAESLLAAALNFSDAANIMARESGTVVSVGVREGQIISRGDIIATIGVADSNFVLEISSTFQDAEFIEIGDEATILKSGSANLRGIVSDVRPIGDTLVIRLYIETDTLSGGEYVRVRFSTQTGLHQMVVPNSAVFQGAMGQHYVWFVQSTPGTLGTEYRSVRVSVFIDDSDNFNTAISIGMGMMWNMPVIINYSRALTVNGRVSRME